METKVLLDRLEDIERDPHNMTRRSLTAIIEEIEALVPPSSIECWEEEEQYGTKKYAKLIFHLQPSPLTVIIEQTGGNGIYSTYFNYEY